MKKLFYILMVAGLFFGSTSCEGDEPASDQSQAETPDNGGNDNDGENENNDSENPNPAEGDILVVYYSYTNNTHTIVTDLLTQIDADVVRVEPAEKGLDYAANNYAIGSALIAAIRENPNDASSYPAIDPVDVELENYATVIVAAPLWWSNMAAPLQTFLFNHGSEMAGKNIGLIVSSASSGISGVEADAKRLIPEGNFLTPSLWIRSSQTSNCHEMTAEWLKDTGLIE
jgi:hypothetical protein